MPCGQCVGIGQAHPNSCPESPPDEDASLCHSQERRTRSARQGDTPCSRGLGFGGVNGVRQGKLIELDLDDTVADAAVEEMCRKLLANTVIENFRIERV